MEEYPNPTTNWDISRRVIFKRECKNFLKSIQVKSSVAPDALKSLSSKGYYLVPNYYTQERCQKLRTEIDELFIKYKDKLWIDSLKSDYRIFGANRASALVYEFCQDPFIHNIWKNYDPGLPSDFFTTVGRLKFIEGNHGSGGGWHRDCADGRQFKSIIYLSDVERANGPFEYIEGSHKPLNFLRGWLKHLYGHEQYRFTEADVEKYLASFPNQKKQTFLGKAGTLLLVDTRGIHRGSPIFEGVRYAMTNYFFSNKVIPDHINSFLINSKQEN